MRNAPRTKLKQDNQLGSEVMSYLHSQFVEDGRYDNTEKDVDGGMDIPSLRDRVRFTAAAEPDTPQEGRVRLGLGLSSDIPMYKRASIFTTPIHELVDGYRGFVKSPLVDSALVGSAAGGLTYLLGNYFNPITADDVTQETANIVRDERIALTGENLPRIKKRAMQNLKRRKLLTAGAVGLGFAGLNSAYHYEPGNPSSLYKFSSCDMRKTASLDPLATSVDINKVKAAVLDSGMTDGNKFLSMSMLNTIDKPMVNSNDIIGAAINTGVSSLGAPIGQYTVAAAMDAATGYLGGSLLGISRPDRLAAAVGVGSFLGRTMQPQL